VLFPLKRVAELLVLLTSIEIVCFIIGSVALCASRILITLANTWSCSAPAVTQSAFKNGRSWVSFS